jgi:hypothetical protein
MTGFSEIVSHTPIWVWFVMAYGIWVGVRAFSERKVSLTMASLLPIVFFGLSLSSLIGVAERSPAVGLVWLLAVAAGVVLGWFYLSAEPLEVHRGRGTLLVPGTWAVLVLFVVIFITKFTYGIEQATNPDLASSLVFQVVVFALSGLSTGIVTGRTTRLYNRYFQAAA